MKAKDGYKSDKHKSNIGNWLKRYFSKRTCRKSEIQEETSPEYTKIVDDNFWELGKENIKEDSELDEYDIDLKDWNTRPNDLFHR